MGQILVIQDQGEIGASLSTDYSVVRATAAEGLRHAMSTQSFKAAVLVRGNEAETRTLLTTVHEADPDLAIVLIVPPADEAGNAPVDDSTWEIIHQFSPEALRSAVRRASQHTELSRENRALRGQMDHGQNAGGEVNHNGNGANGAHLHWIASLPPRFDLRELLSSVEKGVIQRTLEATRGAQAEAARRLGLSRSDLSYKLAKYELRKPAAERSN
jgi:DNA-binding NtrC family response regulator